MKERIKEIIASLVYALYQKEILKNQIHVHSIDETIDALIDTDSSLVRFGDGEITLISGIASATQQGNDELAKRLVQVLESQEEGLLVAVCDVFEGMEQLYRDSQNFWKKHLLKFRKDYNRYCRPDRIYYNAFMSRCYYSMKDRSKCGQWFDRIRNIWKDKDIVVVEGEQTHNGVGNNLLSGARTVQRIICPSENAYSIYKQILEACIKFDRGHLFLLSIGAAAKPLAYDLFKKGYRAIDIGNMDLEYEWYLRKTKGKIPLEKHGIIGQEENQKAGYGEYLKQISVILRGEKV